jgi:hypothetical protein
MPSDETCTVEDLRTLVEGGRRFGTIYADPPWLYDNQGTRAGTAAAREAAIRLDAQTCCMGHQIVLEIAP